MADRAIIPMPDWLGLGAEAHLNTPGKLAATGPGAPRRASTQLLASRIQAECEVSLPRRGAGRKRGKNLNLTEM
ncbi:MAG: hypothetical protein ACLVJH_10795 [Faecalibacterium prausnitzii]